MQAWQKRLCIIWLSFVSSQGCYHHMSTFPNKGLLLHSIIWVWNRLSFRLSFMKTGSSISWSCEAPDMVAPSSAVVLPASPAFGATVPCWHNKHEAHIIAQEVDKLIHLTLLDDIDNSTKCAHPYHMPGKFRHIWDYKENNVFIIPSNLTDLDLQNHKAEGPCPHATQPY